MDLSSILASIVTPINVVVGIVIFGYVAIKERVTGGNDDFRSKKTVEKADLDHRSTEYPYTLLQMYDLILRWNNFSAWNINHAQLQSFFDANVSKCHLDVGVGSGYYPSHSIALRSLCSQQGGLTLELWDLNPPPLEYASERIKKACGAGLNITTRQVNLLDDRLPENVPLRFTTASMNYVFHCVVYPKMDVAASNEERTIEKFYRAFKQVKSVMAEGGIISGTTILTWNDSAIPPKYSRLRLYLARNRMHDLQTRIVHFYNQHDTMTSIEQGAKRAGLKKKTTFIVGVVAHFVFQV